MQSFSGPTSFQDDNGNDVERHDGVLHRRRNTNPFLSSWLPPLSLSPPAITDHGQDDIQHHQHHRHHNAHRPLPPDSLQDPHFPLFAFSLSNSVEFASSTATVVAVPASSSPSPFVSSSSFSAFDSPSSMKRSESRAARLQGGSFQQPISQMSDNFPSTNTPSSPSSSSAPSGSSNPFMYTPYQPPPTRQPQDQQQQSYNPTRSLSSAGQGRLSLGNAQWLDLEPVSPGASTLVGSPVTPQFDSSQSGRFPWRTPTPVSTSQQHLPPPQYPAPKFRFSLFDSKGCEHDTSSLGGETLGPAAAARTLAHYDRGGEGGGYQGQHQYQRQQHQSSWEPHVSVLMDEISLDSFSPSDNCHQAGDQKSKGSKNKPPAYGNKKWTSTPQSESGQSSNTSMITLLAVQHHSSSTLFGGFKAKTSSGFLKLSDPKFTASDIEQQQRQQGSSIGPDGKVYSNKPRAKQFGKKGGGGGGGGNGDRKALFSNERTFMHWIKFGILLGTTALTLCNFGAIGSLAFYIGVTVLVVAMSSLGYATVLFHWRDRGLERRLQSTLARKQAKQGGRTGTKFIQNEKGEICYYDRLGPTIFCSALLFAYSINFYLSIMNGSSMPNSGQSFFHQE